MLWTEIRSEIDRRRLIVLVDGFLVAVVTMTIVALCALISTVRVRDCR